MVSQRFFTIGSWTLDSLTILASLAFLYIFLRTKEKTIGIYMVIVLNIANLLLHFESMFTLIFLPVQSNPNAWIFANIALYRFTLYWPTIIALFIYLVVKQKSIFNPKKFLGFGFVGCVILACAFAAIVAENVWGIQILYQYPSVFQIQYSLSNRIDQFLYFLFYQVIGIIIPILITLYCYVRIFEVLRHADNSSESQLKASKLFLYCIMQMICFIPSIICELIFAIANSPLPLAVSVTEGCLHRIWAVFNILVFWFFSSTYKERASTIWSRRLSEVSTLLSFEGAENI